ncbi:tonB dependent receptor family protein [Asticcacaulis biprosthecium C19]|uniref:TonB dependent receptor family protein n=1 Tax=Asticcacaulis biprosthecium C19 TaxID=715226 RepID=F4QNQ3_9CAUL|nr:TonB-dependent receptor [Asticcacaulis biprosthecium]EGF90961.1 tonB dependent receptor family protein [Asticcacaulis biprosthecium C19]
MKLNKSIILAGTALASLVSVSGAYAQSTGTEATESTAVVITGSRSPRSIDGALTKENITKSRSTVTQEFIATQPSGQTILNSINLVPGVNFTNNDPYGSSGGNIRIRGFDGNRISLTFDGVPLNDTGNYAIYSNQQLDPELIERATVNQGTTDVDSPTASAAGGTVGYTTVRPTDDFGVNFNLGIGSFAYKRAFLMVNTGEIAGFKSYVTVSKTKYDKFKGPGVIDKTQYNGMIFKGFGDVGDYVSLAVNWNENRNNSYRNITLADFKTNPQLDYDATCTIPKAVGGTAQAASNCGNYFGQRVNPSDTGSLRGKFKYHLTDNLIFTFDPTVQYVLANGGTQTENVNEKNSRLDNDGTDTAGVGKDLNGDGDVMDVVTLWRPSTTNTHRYTVNSSLIWDLDDNHRIRGAYTLDYGRHRQTGAFGYLQANGDPVDVFGGRDNPDNAVTSLTGNVLQNRNRFSIAKLEQFSLDYRGQFLDDKLVVNLGVRAPKLTRELNNYCYQPSGGDFPRCTSEATSGTPTASGNVFFPSTGSTPHIAPISFVKEYSKTLPNVGVSYAIGDSQMIYASYAEQISAPRTDNLYKYSRAAAANSPLVTSIADPETTQSFDLGYRYQSGSILASTALWSTKFHNRIVTTYDPDTLLSVDRNVGDVDMYGWDGQIGWQATEHLSLYASASYNHSELLSDLQLTASTYLPTKGKTLVETPEWTYATRMQWDVNPDFRVGLQGKYVDERFISDVNDAKSDAYTTFDLDLNWDIVPFGLEGTQLQINVINVFDETYLGSLGSTNNTVVINDVDPGTPVVSKSASQPTHSVGAPRTAMLTLKTKF